ncbi:VOC family protein [Phreatobacter stygius]|uniref:Ring-cleaving dioxygenase n=1 Tax=Phreatobacter stygius TaxID=1940610 RepID=A0A4D7B1T3_9HYPH|nr:VOC family protein [Phreatobacter stygius]QCI66761.1 ring-cleaving dioxygenase [Phreatobacter stygius]
MSAGLHHVTLITGRAQANVDFYAGFLGLRLVKRTGGFEDATQLHLFYGDAEGTPGSLVTFLVWEDGAPGRVGLGQFAELALAIPSASIGFWLTRAMGQGVKVAGPTREFGEPVLRLTDPDGATIKLVGVDALEAAAPLASQAVPAEHAVRRLRGATILSDQADETQAFLAAHLGYRETARQDGLIRLASPAGDTLDLRDATGFWPGAGGPGTIDHLAFRTADLDSLRQALRLLQDEGRETSPVKDRRYFTSVYWREPGGALCERATDGPGMAVDEATDHLGETLFVPSETAEAVKLQLPDIALPGEPRERRIDLAFVHRLKRPADPDGSTIVVLHGTGGNETDLMPLAHRIAPRATLLGFRGRSTEDGSLRWFRRFGPDAFDQSDIVAEATAFAATLPEALAFHGLDPGTTTVLGYSNGANFAAATMLLHPGVIRSAVLLRAVQVLEAPPAADLTGARILTVTGNADPFARDADGFDDLLRSTGAVVERRRLAAGHELTAWDVQVVQDWLAGPAAR